MIVGYLDISENNVSRQEQQILLQDYACSTRCRIDVFHCDSDIRNLYQTLQSGRHTVLVANIVSLGSSLRDIRNNLQFIVDNGLSLVSVKEDYTARPNQKTMDILQGFDLALNMRKSMQSIITANSLNRKKADADSALAIRKDALTTAAKTFAKCLPTAFPARKPRGSLAFPEQHSMTFFIATRKLPFCEKRRTMHKTEAIFVNLIRRKA